MKIGNWGCFQQGSHNQRHLGRKEATNRFTSQNMSRNGIERLSKFSLKMNHGGVNRTLRNFDNRKIGEDFASRATTSNIVGKWRRRYDLAHEICLEHALKDFLIEA